MVRDGREGEFRMAVFRCCEVWRSDSGGRWRILLIVDTTVGLLATERYWQWLLPWVLVLF